MLAVTSPNVIYYRGQPGSTTMPIPWTGDEIEDELVARIKAGEYPLDSRLPSTAELALEFGVSPATVYRRIKNLREDGILRGLKGSGVYVVRMPD